MKRLIVILFISLASMSVFAENKEPANTLNNTSLKSLHPLGINKIEAKKNLFYLNSFINRLLNDSIDVESSMMDFNCNGDACYTKISVNNSYDEILSSFKKIYGDKYVQHDDFKVWIIDNLEIGIYIHDGKTFITYRSLQS